MTDDSSPVVSRRRVLRGLGASGAAAVGASGVAAAQSEGAGYTVRMVIPRAEKFTDDYTGLFVLVEARSEGELAVEDVSDCAFDEWSPDGLDSFTGRLVDRVEDDSRDVPVQIYTTADAGVEAGSLYVVNVTDPCPDGYVGLEAEQIRSEDLPANGSGAEETVTPGGTDGGGPGFGVAGAVAGVGGLAGLARALNDEE